MAEIHELIDRVEEPELREQLRAAVDQLAKQKKFGLVFEEHLPECVPLYEVPVKKGRLVSRKQEEAKDIFVVLSVKDGEARCLPKNGGVAVTLPVDALVTVAEFGEPIYPYLRPMDTVCNAPDSDLWHTLIEADNYHALQLLEYLYSGQVDCIYIDPPYNTGAKDWKYNNDYVDSADIYRHSKWLSMMQKRLKLAKRLLNPENSVLIVTIDEKEYLHLGCLLEEVFPNANMQMVSSVINPAGAGRQNEFSRTDEYIFVLRFGRASVLPESRGVENVPIVWDTLRRSDLASRRGTIKGGTAQFYAIYVDDKTHRIVKIGKPLSPDVSIDNVPGLSGCTTVFPIRDNGIEMCWGLRPEQVQSRLEKGYIRVGKYTPTKPQKYVISYVTGGIIKDIDRGEAIISGYNDDGSVIAYYPTGKDKMPTTNWNRPSHDAQRYGTEVLKGIFQDKRFSFPKSLYAVHDILWFFVSNKPNALIVDFFAGSGTTLHAINLLNAEDKGHRRCILVTNNEVSVDEAKSLTAQGFQPGDEEWERLGIARYVTWPRTVCSIKGHDISGQPLKGNYLGSDRPMADGFPANTAYFKLGFLDKTSVALGQQFKRMLPTLWMKAGAIGPCPTLEGKETPPMLVLPENGFAVLNEQSAFERFAAAVNANDAIQTVYIVTDYVSGYQAMARQLKAEKTYQLYRDYLENFRINTGRDSR